MHKLAAASAIFLALPALGASRPTQKDLQVDLNGDGTPESVVLSQAPGKITITVRGSASGKNAQTLSFGVDPARQDAVCKLPASLEISTQDCKPEALGGDRLEGCKIRPLAKELVLSDGQCDPIHLYWNHQKKSLWWWRA